ncbi:MULTISPECIES: hypothetical protein [unclassified Streptomyces]|uniref:hypothetical protein n=1 Tax=unclassified Streptomyces TaxID=2593676 RepID=UPI000BF8064B|nr:hypothetical protein [Streptomyces sp. Ru87]PGH48309.1 hypothetical protein CRI70_23935 [Streptomyces sp. Ru87]
MVVTLVIVCEVAFWVLLAAGLALRYLAGKRRAGAAVLLCEPLLELVLLVATAVDLRGGAEPDWTHGLAAVYIGFTVGYGHYLITWADGHFAHRFAGGEKPEKPPKYGMARAVHEWRMCARSLVAAGVAAALLQGAVWYIGEGGKTGSLVQWQAKMGLVAVVSLIIAVSYTIWPKQAPARPEPSAAERLAEFRKHAGR